MQSVIALASIILLPNLSAAQNYFYSVFPTLTSGNYSYEQPSRGVCAAPTVNTPEAIADNSFLNYASYGGLVTAPLTCTTTDYVFRAKLNLDSKTEPTLAGYDAGFVIQTAAAGDIRNNISISTFLGGTLQESATGADLLGVELVSAVNPSFIYFKTTKDFDEVVIKLGESLIQLNIISETRVYFAQARNSAVLPVSLTSFKAALQNNRVAVSWTAVNEYNVNHYNIEKSSDGVHYTVVSTIAAKGTNGSNNIYTYNDAALMNGSYLYRIRSVDNDGAVSVTNAISVAVAGKKDAMIYPSVLQRGQQLWIKTATASTYTISVFDIQGKMIKQERKVSDGLTSINTANLAAGTYVLKLVATDGSATQFRFIVN